MSSFLDPLRGLVGIFGAFGSSLFRWLPQLVGVPRKRPARKKVSPGKKRKKGRFTKKG